MEYASSYQHVTGATQISNALEGKVSPETLLQIQKECGDSRVGLLECLKAGEHISRPYLQAKHLAERTNLLQVVVFNDSFFNMSVEGQCGGPLAAQCRPSESDAKEWAHAALQDGDIDLFAAANAVLPERPKVAEG